MKIIYDKTCGRIVTIIPNDMEYQKMFCEFNEQFVNNLKEITIDNISIETIYTHKIENEELVQYNDLELYEIKNYGRVLLDYERLLESLKPSNKDVIGAENAIEILTMLSGVL